MILALTMSALIALFIIGGFLYSPLLFGCAAVTAYLLYRTMKEDLI